MLKYRYAEFYEAPPSHSACSDGAGLETARPPFGRHDGLIDDKLLPEKHAVEECDHWAVRFAKGLGGQRGMLGHPENSVTIGYRGKGA